MFSFHLNESTDKGDQSTGGAPQKNEAVPDNELYRRLLKLTAEPEGSNSDIASVVSDSTYSSTDISELSMNSHRRITVDRDFNSLYKQTLDSFLNRLDEATNPMTPQDQALDLFNELHIWAMNEGSNHDDSSEIRNEVFLKLLRYIRSNLDEKQCVFKAVTLIDCLSCHKDRDPLEIVEADAVKVFVLVLLSHNSYSFYSQGPMTSEYGYECFVWRTWDILLDIVLAPTFVNYFQRFDEESHDERKESQRTKLLILVQFLLDVCGHSMTAPRMGQMFDMLSILLQVDYYSIGSLEPYDEVRSSVFEMKIASKCLHILMAKPRNAKNNDFDEISPTIQALEFYWLCLCDCDDDLSKSLDKEALARWVRRTLAEFPNSGDVQGRGCQILNGIIARRSAAENCASSVASHIANRSNDCSGRNLIDRCYEPRVNDKYTTRETEGSEEPLTLIDMAGTLLNSTFLCVDEKFLEESKSSKQ